MKTKTVLKKPTSNRLQRVKKSLDRLANGMPSELNIYQCCAYISWLSKWKIIPTQEINILADKATEILESQR